MPKQIFIVSGGTGGHIIPARCLAQYFAQNNHKVLFLGDEKYRSYIKESDQFASKIISSSQIKKSPVFLAKAACQILIGIFQSIYLFWKLKPKYIFAFGGYSTFPALIAAIITRTEIILHEQNSHLGKVNRIFAKFAKKIGLSFKETSGISSENLSKSFFVGNPVRDEILGLHEAKYEIPMFKDPELRKDNKMGYDLLLASDFYEEQEPKKTFNILVIGGSGGAKIFSEILPQAFFNLSENLKEEIQVTQQCRKELLQQTFNTYRSFNVNIVIDAFFENMPELIKAAHLVIARSGSSSIFEFCAAKKPMILVPFALAADNHQEKNARYLEKNGAAIVVEEKEFTINKINDLLNSLISDKPTLKKMSENAGSLAILDATKNLASLAND